MDKIKNIYVINLPKDIDRKYHMQSKLELIGLSAQFIQGINGKTLDSITKSQECTPMCSEFCTPGQIGCALSHKKIWRQIVENQIPISIIMEDDIYFNPDFKTILNKIIFQVSEGWDIIYLGCLGACDPLNRYDLFNRVFAMNSHSISISDNLFVPSFPLGLHCYMLSLNGAIKLLNFIPKIWQHLDYSISLVKSKLNMYASNPSLAFTNVETTTSNNINNTYPAYINKFLDKQKDNNIGYGYKLSIPIYNIYGYHLNLYTFIFIFLGLLSALLFNYLKLNKQKSLLYASLFILLFNLPEILHLKKENAINMVVNSFLFLAPNV